MTLAPRAQHLFAALLTSQLATAAPGVDDPVRDLAPRDKRPYTAAVETAIRMEAGLCLERAKLGVGAAADRRERLFTECMEEKGYVRIPRADHDALQVLGRVQDCLDGVGVRCAEAVIDYVQGVADSAVRLLPTEGLRAGRALCTGGDGEVCLALASLHLTGFLDWGPDERLALRFAEDGCAAHHAGSCAFAGALLVGDHAVIERDLELGKRYLARACEGGVVDACAWPPRDPPPREAVLPVDHRWCRYAAAHDGCAPSLWVSVPTARECAPDVAFGIPECRYDLDRSGASPR